MTPFFTAETTEGFSEPEIAIMNEAAAIIMERNPGIDRATVCDIINNAWSGGQTAAALTDSAGF